MTKLVTILARKLVEWPEGETFATMDPDKEVRFSESSIHDFFASELAEDAGEDYGEGFQVTREMWQAERERLIAQERDGEGLPPVGIICENKDHSCGIWGKVRIVAHHIDPGWAIFTEELKEGGALYYGQAGDFRPIKSRRDKWIEAACESMKGARFTMQNTDVAPMELAALYAGAVYDAGLAKMPEVE